MLAEILNFQGAKPCLGVGSFSYLQFEQTFFTIVFYTKERKELMQTTFFHNTRRTGKFSVRLLLFRDVLLEALSTGIPEMCVLHKTAFHIFQSLCTLFQTPMLL